MSASLFKDEGWYFIGLSSGEQISNSLKNIRNNYANNIKLFLANNINNLQTDISYNDNFYYPEKINNSNTFKNFLKYNFNTTAGFFNTTIEYGDTIIDLSDIVIQPESGTEFKGNDWVEIDSTLYDMFLPSYVNVDNTLKFSIGAWIYITSDFDSSIDSSIDLEEPSAWTEGSLITNIRYKVYSISNKNLSNESSLLLKNFINTITYNTISTNEIGKLSYNNILSYKKQNNVLILERDLSTNSIFAGTTNTEIPKNLKYYAFIGNANDLNNYNINTINNIIVNKLLDFSFSTIDQIKEKYKSLTNTISSKFKIDSSEVNNSSFQDNISENFVRAQTVTSLITFSTYDSSNSDISSSQLFLSKLYDIISEILAIL